MWLICNSKAEKPARQAENALRHLPAHAPVCMNPVNCGAEFSPVQQAPAA
jgi:uncharacterized protein YgiB involved in biofilm formation